jgi:hypothetical protein
VGKRPKMANGKIGTSGKRWMGERGVVNEEWLRSD